MAYIDFDKPRTLKFDIEAFHDLEAAMGGQPLGTIVQQLGQFSVSALTLALWSGLKKEDRSLSPNLVKKMLNTYIENGGNVRVLLDVVSEAITSSGLIRNIQDDEPVSSKEPGNATAATT